jgi:hypothetical protein
MYQYVPIYYTKIVTFEQQHNSPIGISKPDDKKVTSIGWEHGLSIIDQQSVGKRSLYLMDTANAKKRWTTIYLLVNNF